MSLGFPKGAWVARRQLSKIRALVYNVHGPLQSRGTRPMSSTQKFSLHVYLHELEPARRERAPWPRAGEEPEKAEHMFEF